MITQAKNVHTRLVSSFTNSMVLLFRHCDVEEASFWARLDSFLVWFINSFEQLLNFSSKFSVSIKNIEDFRIQSSKSL